MRAVSFLPIAVAMAAAMIAWPRPTAAQPFPGSGRCEGGVAGLRLAISNNWDNQVALMSKRGFSLAARPRPGGPRAADAADQAGEVMTWLSGLPAGTASLIFAAEGDRHCVYVVDRDSLARSEPYFVVGDVSPAELKQMHASWRRMAAVDQVGARGRRTIQLPSGGVDPEPPHARSDAALSMFSAALLPGEARARLARYKRVLVLPYADLGVVPYPALQVERGRRFVDTTAFMVLPGAQLAQSGSPVWVSGRPRGACRSPAPGRRPLVVGDPAPRGEDARSFPRLPGAEAEAAQVARKYGTIALTGEAATMARIAEAAPGSPILHLAVHGSALNNEPLNSFLVLADGRWTARDIMSVCLDGTDIAVLSACQSGLGEPLNGGIIGLARSFYLAGVDNVVMSLWSVDDAATKDLMVAFTDELKALGRDPDVDEALRRAMLTARRKHPDPSKWAAFSVFGSSMIPGKAPFSGSR